MGQPESSDSIEHTVELVRLAQRGDGGALGSLVERYLPRVETIVRARLGAGLRRELESGDVVQETLIEVLKNLDRFEQRDEQSFVRWVSTIVENRLRQDARFFAAVRRNRQNEVAISDDSLESGGVPEPPAAGEGPATLAEKHELIERTQRAREALSENHRRVLDLREAGGAWADVADQLGLASPDAARMLHARANLALLRSVMPDEESG